MVFRKFEPNTWKYTKEFDSIEGTLIDVRPNVGINKATVYTLDCGDKKVDVWGTTVIDEKMRPIQKGTKIKLVYLGKKKNYHNFELLVDDGQAEEPILPPQPETQTV